MINFINIWKSGKITKLYFYGISDVRSIRKTRAANPPMLHLRRRVVRQNLLNFPVHWNNEICWLKSFVFAILFSYVKIYCPTKLTLQTHLWATKALQCCRYFSENRYTVWELWHFSVKTFTPWILYHLNGLSPHVAIDKKCRTTPLLLEILGILLLILIITLTTM